MALISRRLDHARRRRGARCSVHHRLEPAAGHRRDRDGKTASPTSEYLIYSHHHADCAGASSLLDKKVKPAFNAFRLLHLLGDTVVSTSGGTTGNGVNAVATVSADGSAVQVLVYNHVSGGTASSSTTNPVELTVNNIPGAGSLTVRQYVLDRGHSNSYQKWVSLSSPAKPSQAQWTQLSSAAELCHYQASGSGASWTVTYPQAVYGVSLFVLSR
jgi:hypothetical protein